MNFIGLRIIRTLISVVLCLRRAKHFKAYTSELPTAISLRASRFNGEACWYLYQ
ncbi:MAG: hypothetical protein ACTSWF_04380 [Candidatus Freyarchaeota archaeon]